MTTLPDVKAPVVRRILDLSTAHLPKQYAIAADLLDNPLNAVPGVIAYRTHYGFLMWVPDEPVESAKADADKIPDVVLNIQLYARSLDCDYVMFDADADVDTRLPTYEW